MHVSVVLRSADIETLLNSTPEKGVPGLPAGMGFLANRSIVWPVPASDGQPTGIMAQVKRLPHPLSSAFVA